MPFVSAAQRRWGHTEAGTKALGGPEKVAEWDRSSKGLNLPERVMNKGHLSKSTAYAEGGAVLGRSRDFLKESDGADQNVIKRDGGYKNPDLKSQDYGKPGGQGEDGGAPKARPDKSLKAVKPRG